MKRYWIVQILIFSRKFDYNFRQKSKNSTEYDIKVCMIEGDRTCNLR